MFYGQKYCVSFNKSQKMINQSDKEEGEGEWSQKQ
jgi:hypothetical protein